MADGSPFTNPAGRASDAGLAYRRAIEAVVGDRDPLEIQRNLLAGLRRVLAGLSEEQLRRPEAPGKWSIAQVVQHLADSEVVFGWRLRCVLGQDRPVITGFDQDSWVRSMPIDVADLHMTLKVLEVNREANLRLLGWARREGHWDRAGLHEERGEESVEVMARLYAGHDLVHLEQIRRIRGTLPGAGAAP